MKEDIRRIYVQILDKEYHIACRPNEKDALLSAAEELDGRMRKVRHSGSVIGMDRIAVMVALNLCHELQQERATNGRSSLQEDELQRLSDKLEIALQR